MTTLTFLIPLRPKESATDWSLVSRLCIQTVSSCLLNTSDGIRVWLIGHHKPHGFDAIDDWRFRFILADTPPSERSLGPSGMKDKWAKLSQGLVELSRDPTDYLMFVDADDLVSSRLHSYLDSSRPRHGLILRDGYRYWDGSGWIERVYGSFNCGTNSVIATSSIDLPRNNTFGEIRRCVALTVGHMGIEKAMADQDTPLSDAPFPAAIYVRHGEQHSLNGFRSASTLRDFAHALKSKARDPSRFLSLRRARPVLRDFVA